MRLLRRAMTRLLKGLPRKPWGLMSTQMLIKVLKMI